MQRVSTFSFSRRAVHFNALHNSNIARIQQQISSGVRFDAPSEDPLSFRMVASLNSRLVELEADQGAIQQSSSILNASVTYVQEYIDIVTRAKSVTQQGIQALDSAEREAYAIEVEGMLDQMKQISLARFNDRYLFSGTKSKVPPFEFVDPAGNVGTLQAVYHGSDQRSRASVGESIGVDTYYSGLELFGRRDRGETILTGNTGAKVGVGTDTITGSALLTIEHVATTYQAGSGVAPGSDSVIGDTVIGGMGDHYLTIVDTAGDGSAGTVQLNGGIPFEFTDADSNLRVLGPSGQEVFVDTTNITAGFNGDVQLQSTGTASVDGGVTNVAIDFSNQVLVDSQTDNAVSIDTSQVRRVGTDRLDFPGTSDVFSTLFNLARDLRNEDGISADKLSDVLDYRLGELEALSNNGYEVLGQQSTSLQTLDTLDFTVTELMLEVQTKVIDTQGTDIPEAVVKLQNSQNLLQYTYAITAQMDSLGLLQFLR